MSTNIDRAADIIEYLEDETHLYPDGGLPDEVAQALDDEGLLAPDPQIIRTVEELEALDPDTLLTYIGYFGSYITAVCLHPDELPAVVVTTTAQVRAAREALEEA